MSLSGVTNRKINDDVNKACIDLNDHSLDHSSEEKLCEDRFLIQLLKQDCYLEYHLTVNAGHRFENQISKIRWLSDYTSKIIFYV